MLLVLTLFASFGWRVLAAEPPVFPAEPAPATKKKAATPSKKPAAKPADTAAKGDEVIPLPNPEPAVVSQKAIVVRGQPRLNSEIVARLKQGDKITVLEEIKTKKRADEPDRWYKINLPTGTGGVWVESSFLDENKKVKPNRLNVRSGPSENYSVIARIDKGTAVNVVETKGGWSKIDPPSTAYAYVAAHLVTREPAGAVVARHTPPTPPPPPPTPPPTVVVPPPTAVQTPDPVVPPPTIVQAPPPTVIQAPPPPPPVVTPPPGQNVVTPSVNPKMVLVPVPGDEPLPKRIVTREGIVRGSVSVQAPTHFVLRSLDNKKTINYLFSTSTNITVGEYRGLRVIVTGEEQLDERWPNTPVIEIETLKPLE